MPPQVGSQVEVCEQCGVVSWHWQPIAKPDLIIFIKMYYVAVEGVCTSCKGVLKRQNVTMSTFVDKSRHIFLIQENPQNRHWQPIAKAGKPTLIISAKILYLLNLHLVDMGFEKTKSGQKEPFIC